MWLSCVWGLEPQSLSFTVVQLALAPPPVVMALGTLAQHTLTSDTGVSSWTQL